MRGSPPLHLILFVIGFALLAVPLAQLTFARAERSATLPSQHAIDKTPIIVRMRFAHAPSSVSLKLDGIEVLPTSSTQHPATRIEARAALPLPPEGIELSIAAKWPEGTPDTAVTIELEPDGLEAQSQTRWSRKHEMNDVLAYEWRP
jgi:hypothetical protein